MSESPSTLGSASWIGVDENSKPTAVALIIHGLNLRPSKMLGIADMLAALGVECLNVALSGHGDHASSGPDHRRIARLRQEAFKSVTRSVWLSEAHEAYLLASARASEQGVPLILVGYSLGAAIGSDLAGERAPVSFDGMILFAPAFTVRWYVRALRLLALFPRLTLPSLSPADYAANAGTPIAAYNALFESIAAHRKRRGTQLATAALIFMDPEDELVSYRGLRAMCRRPEASRWRMVSIRRTLRRDQRDYHHLIIDPAVLGSKRWSSVTDHVKQFLASL